MELMTGEKVSIWETFELMLQALLEGSVTSGSRKERIRMGILTSTGKGYGQE
jgi:hypothetical protein